MKWSSYRKYFKGLTVTEIGIVISHILYKTDVSPDLKKVAERVLSHGLTGIEQGPYPFSQFWQDYGRKEGRLQCEKLYAKTTKAEQEQIMKHLPVYVSTREKQFRLKPEKYLRHKAYNDEIISTTTKTRDGAFQGNTRNDPERVFDLILAKTSKQRS